MKVFFKVEKLQFVSIQELPNSWTNQNYLDLLDLMDYDETSALAPKELKEMCLMSLSDNDPEAAAKIVLEYIFKNRLSKGQIDNLSNEILDEKMWEEYADLSMHEEFFNVTQLLYQAFNGIFPHPRAVMFRVKVTAISKEDLSVFNIFPEAPLIRLLVAGLSENTLIFRLFEEQVDGHEFLDAKDIIWQLTADKKAENELIFNVISSSYWFHDLKYITSYKGETHADVVSETNI
ncbi:MAG: hypothetical protein KJN85_11270 [Maribacter sp.]|nr:hypothetical protein [Maribacter sp.]